MSPPVTPAELRLWAGASSTHYATILAAALEAAHKRIAELEAELDAARRWYRL